MPKKPAKSDPLAAPAPFRAALAAWFGDEGRDYPWRRTRDPYAILVSEVMLQQTQVATVLGRNYYTDWLERFPDVAALAAASEAEILRAWEGLGYYSRARNLQNAARAVVAGHGGVFPTAPDAIRALPGVGRYTAGAVASFAFDLPLPIVDANVARVLARLFDFRREVDSAAGQRQLWEWAGALVPEGAGSRVHNSALMELGQRICTPRAPACAACPVARFCRAPAPESLPLKRPRRKTVERDEFAIYALRGGEILLHQEGRRRRQGLWKLPERPYDEVAGHPCVLRMKYSITHFRVSLFVHQAAGADAREGEGEAWHPVEALPDLAMPSPYRRALAKLADGRESIPLSGG
ncbi:A/G-specific adenine glycosylase [soil metagenome]